MQIKKLLIPQHTNYPIMKNAPPLRVWTLRANIASGNYFKPLERADHKNVVPRNSNK